MRAAVVSRSDAPPVFEPAERVFDFMALFVEGLIVIMLDFAVLFRRDAGFDPFFDQGFAEPIAVIAPVAGQRLGVRHGREHEFCPFVIAHLTLSQHQDQRLTAAIGDSVQL